MTRVLLIEDDPTVRRVTVLGLGRRGYETEAVATGEDGLVALKAFKPDIVLLDLMLRGINGLEVCRRIRKDSQLPIIILSARGEDIDVVLGLEAGADDYVVKPASGELIEARMRAVLRRVALSQTGVEEQHGLVTLGDLQIDRDALRVRKHGTDVPLAPSEMKLLLFLSAAPEQVFSRQQLLDAVWAPSCYSDTRLVDACVMRLRAKIEDDPKAPRYIQTVWGFGYRLGPL